MNTIDRRRHYFLCIDTEATNCVGKNIQADALPYDIGFAVQDTHGAIYETHSYVNSDIFYDEPELMKSAYYARKLPRYHEEIACGLRTVANTWEIRRKMFEVMEKYGIKEVVAHNAHFDYTVLNNIVKYLSGSRVRNWFPFGMVEWWDSLNMAKSVMLKMPTYEKFCIEELGLPKANAKAETLYRFIIKDPDFIESHTALEDVLIESQIVAYCYRQHKEMRKKLFTKELPEMTPFQLAVFMGVRNNPMI